MAGPRTGDPAPDFSLPATDGRVYRLGDLLGRPVIIAFYVADTGPLSVTCARQMRSYSEHWDELTNEAVVLAIARPDVGSHQNFARKNELKMPLLADTDGAVARAYGVAGRFGITQRSIFVVDREGIVRWKHLDPTGITYRSPREVIERIKELTSQGAE